MATLGDDDNGKKKAIHEFTRNKTNESRGSSLRVV
jgi:hypothetical protein